MSHIWSKPFISHRILLYLIFLAAPTNQKWSDIHCKSYSSRQNIRFGWRSIFCGTPVLKDIWYANDLTRIIIAWSSSIFYLFYQNLIFFNFKIKLTSMLNVPSLHLKGKKPPFPNPQGYWSMMFITLCA